MANKIIKQKNYGNIEIDRSENDIVILWGNTGTEAGASDPQCVHIERKNIPALIKTLQHEANKKA